MPLCRCTILDAAASKTFLRHHEVLAHLGEPRRATARCAGLAAHSRDQLHRRFSDGALRGRTDDRARMGTHHQCDDQFRHDAGGGILRLWRVEGGARSKLRQLGERPRRHRRDRQHPGAGRTNRYARILPAGKPRPAVLLDPQIMAVPVVWLASPQSDGVSGCRFIARDWDRSLPAAEAAARVRRRGGVASAGEKRRRRPRRCGVITCAGSSEAPSLCQPAKSACPQPGPRRRRFRACVVPSPPAPARRTGSGRHRGST